jgi:uncharacterized protein (DUF1684 family)
MARMVALLVSAVLITQSADYRAEIEAFRAAIEAEVTGPAGWASLVGLHWLSPGVHTIGAHGSNAIVLESPSAPARLGLLTVLSDRASLEIQGDTPGTIEGKPIRTAELRPGTPADEGLQFGDLTMVVIRRGTRLALRVWDRTAPSRHGFTGLKWHPIDVDWRIDARYVPLEDSPTVKVMTVLNELVEMKHPGYVEFTIGDRTHRLLALLESPDAKQLFFMFRDDTSGKTTYAAGRYLYAPLPVDGRVVLDFNKAKNPPCAFTEHATCPLPPPRNRLMIKVEAGELDYKKKAP